MDQNSLGINFAKSASYFSNKAGSYFHEVKGYLGSVVELTSLSNFISQEKSEGGFHKYLNPMTSFLSFVSTINKTTLFFFEFIQNHFNDFSYTNVIERISAFEWSVSVLNLAELPLLFSEVIKYPQQVREAVKTSEVAKVILKGMVLVSKVVKVPGILLDVIAPAWDWLKKVPDIIDLKNILNPDITSLKEILAPEGGLKEALKADIWGPTLSGISIVLSTAGAALSIWDIHDTRAFANKMKKKCCLELIHQLKDELKNDFKDNPDLIAKLDAAVASKKGHELKKIHKKESEFKNELEKRNPNPSRLRQLLQEIKLPEGNNRQLIDQLNSTINSYELNKFLSDPDLKESLIQTTSELLNTTFHEMTSLSEEGKKVDLVKLKKELKAAAKKLPPEIRDKIDRAAKLAYLNVLHAYKPEKLKNFYQVDPDQLKGSIKKTVDSASKRFGQIDRIERGDEKLTIAYRNLKGRVSHKANTGKFSLFFQTMSIASSSIALAITLKALVTLGSVAAAAIPPLGITLGALAAAGALALILYRSYKTIQFKETMGISKVNSRAEFDDKLRIYETDPVFTGSLTSNDKTLLEKIRNTIDKGKFHEIIYQRFKIPKVNIDSTKEEWSLYLKVKTLNRLVDSINARGQRIRSNAGINHHEYLSSTLKRINFNNLPDQRSKSLYLQMNHIINKKQFYRLDKVRPFPIQENWSPEEKNSVKTFNTILRSVHKFEESECKLSLKNLENKIPYYQSLANDPKNKSKIIELQSRINKTAAKIKLKNKRLTDLKK